MRTLALSIGLCVLTLAIAGCSGNEPAGDGIVGKPTNEAQERRAASYLYYQEQEPSKSAAWVDQMECIGAATYGTVSAAGDYLIPQLADPTVAESRLRDARQVGDQRMEAASLAAQIAGRQFAEGTIGSMREAMAEPLSACTTSELSTDDVEVTVQSAIDFELDHLNLIGPQFGLGPWSGPDGTPVVVAEALEPSAQPVNESTTVGGAICEEMIVWALESWAEGELDQDYLLSPFTPEGREAVRGLMDYVTEANLEPNEAAGAMGNAYYGEICFATGQ